MNTFDRVAIKEEAKRVLRNNRSLLVSAQVVLSLLGLVVTALTAGILGVIVTSLISVAAAGFFAQIWRGENRSVGDMVSSMLGAGALRRIGGILWMSLKVMLWTLLLFVPGIVKTFSYFLTPYILAEYPDVPAMEASRLSEKMMYGHRAEVFLTTLSFIGWGLLSVLTANILFVVHVGPYMQLTFAAIYEEIKHIALEDGVITVQELENGGI